MNWPLKIQGRFLSKVDVDEIRILLCEHTSLNRSRLSRELCVRWFWKRPDGQIKDMACRELLRKLESRSLIKLPPRQRPGPGKPPEIEVIEIDQHPISCILSDIQPVQVVNARKTVEYEKTFNHLVKTYCYVACPMSQRVARTLTQRVQPISAKHSFCSRCYPTVFRNRTMMALLKKKPAKKKRKQRSLQVQRPRGHRGQVHQEELSYG